MNKLTVTTLLALILVNRLWAADSLPEVDELIAANKTGEASVILQRYSDSRPGDVARYQSILAMQNNDHKQALRLAEQAVELDPHPINLAHLGDSWGFRAMNVGILKKMGAAKKARKAWEQALAKDPDLLGAHESLLQFHLMAPGIAGGDKDKASYHAAQIVQRDQQRGLQAQLSLAQAADDSDQVLALAQTLFVDYPDNPNHGVQLGFVLQQAEQYDKAIDTLSQTTQRHPEHWSAHYQLGRTAAVSGNHLEVGRRGLERFIDAADDTSNQHLLASAHWRLAMIEQHADQLDQARVQIKQALSIDPKHKEAKRLKRKLK